jgi:phage shock protein PspC (stress-responsive transcriptional regulator)
VCGGIAEWRGWNPTLVRVLFVLIALFPLIPGILVYVLLWLLIPRERAEDLSASCGQPREGVR